MATKRPKNGIDLSYRRSHMKSQHNVWEKHLQQGAAEKIKKEAERFKIDKVAIEKQQLKKKYKQEALQLDVEFGFKQARPLPEWKKQKNFLAFTFPFPVISKKFNGQLVFKNKQSKQQYQRDLITEEEWANNVALLAAMREIYDKENNVEPSIPDGNGNEYDQCTNDDNNEEAIESSSNEEHLNNDETYTHDNAEHLNNDETYTHDNVETTQHSIDYINCKQDQDTFDQIPSAHECQENVYVLDEVV